MHAIAGKTKYAKKKKKSDRAMKNMRNDQLGLSIEDEKRG